jgi:hypothetical protein
MISSDPVVMRLVGLVMLNILVYLAVWLLDKRREKVRWDEDVHYGTVEFFNQGWMCFYACRGRVFSSEPEDYEHADHCPYLRRESR